MKYFFPFLLLFAGISYAATKVIKHTLVADQDIEVIVPKGLSKARIIYLRPDGSTFLEKEFNLVEGEKIIIKAFNKGKEK